MAQRTIPTTGTRIETVDIAPAPVPAPVTPQDLSHALTWIQSVTEALRTQGERIRGRLRECPPTQAEQDARVRTFLEQAEPGYELKQLTSHARTTYQAWRDFDGAREAARQAREDSLGLLARAKESLLQQQPHDVRAMEQADVLRQSLHPVSFATSRLNQELEATHSLAPVARECVLRLVHAAGVVGRQWQVEQATARLTRLRQVAETIRASTDEDRLGDLTTLVAEQCGTPLPIPRITWPPDLFTPPTLQDN